MEIVSEKTPRKSRIAALLVFLIHQVIATGIVYLTARLPLALAADLLWPVGVRFPQSSLILVSPPYFTLQIIWALFLGWSLSGYLRHRSMLWVWVVPTLMFCYVFIQYPTSPALFQDRAFLSSSSPLSHFFGRDCQPRKFCFDQLFLTLPFYTAAAYSLGAWWARKMSWLSNYAEAMNDINMPRACLVGTVLVCVDLGSTWRFLAHSRVAQSWIGVVGVLWAEAMMFALSTYIFMVVISLIGRRFFLTRWFLNQGSPAVDVETKEQS